MFIHVNKDQWPSLVKEMFRVLKPGGYIELIERDLWHHSSGPVQQAFQSFFKQQCTLLNLDIELTDTLEVSLSDAGFEEVDRKILDIPIGEWPSEPGMEKKNPSTLYIC
jgi:hypothetical protein